MLFSKGTLLLVLGLATSTNAATLKNTRKLSTCTQDATLVNDELAGNFESAPIDILSQDGDFVTFTVSQTWSDEKLCLITTYFKNENDDYTCPLSPNVGPGEFATYTAKCVDGEATVDIYVYDPLLPESDSPTIPDICEQSVAKHTYEYSFVIPCNSGGDDETCPPPVTDVACADFETVTMDFSTAEQVESFLFGKGSGSLVLDETTTETSKIFDVPSDATAMTFDFDFILPSGSMPEGQKVYIRTGPYYLDVSAALDLEVYGTSSQYYAESLVAIFRKDLTTFKMSVTVPPTLYPEGRVNLGMRTFNDADDATFSAEIDNIKLDANCWSFTDGPKAGGGGGDPHFQRWGREHTTFHGECDLVMVHSAAFHNHAGLDLHVRTTIETYFSYIETAALRVGDFTMEFYNDHFFLDGVKLSPANLPVTFGGQFKYTISNGEIEERKNEKYYQYYQVDLHEGSTILFKFYKKYLTISIAGHAIDFIDSVGLLGDYQTGDMVGRHGQAVSDYNEYGFEWQVTPDDKKLFREDRSPQLPFEQCRMPTAARPARRLRGADAAFYEEAKHACAHVAGTDFDLCAEDIMATGDVGLGSLW